MRKKKKNYQMFYLNLWSSWNWMSCGESWKSLLPIFLMFHWTNFGGFLACCDKAIQQLNGVEKDSVAISLMLNHNLSGLKVSRTRLYLRQPYLCLLLVFFYICFQTCFLVASERSFFASPIIYSSVQNKEEPPAHFEKRYCLFLALQKETMVKKLFCSCCVRICR